MNEQKKRKYGKNFIVFPFIKGFFYIIKKDLQQHKKRDFLFHQKY